MSQVARTWLRACLYHELHHLVRHTVVPLGGTLMDRVVSEGLATAFERDFARTSPPWGDYTVEAASWAQELLKLPRDTDGAAWASHNVDGPRWANRKVGTYLVDRAIRASGQSSAELVRRSTEDIVKLATTSSS